MHTLLLRLAGPMQSWGTQSRFKHRDTGQEPSKSGVIGLLCAALGRPREEHVNDLAGLSFGVRVDREGAVKRDYQVAMDVATLSGGTNKHPILTNRFYLADAEFLVGFSGADLEQLRQIEAALREPTWQLYLGRKSFVPSLPVALPITDGRTGLRVEMGLAEALRGETWCDRKGSFARLNRPNHVRYEIEVEQPDRAERRIDQPARDIAFGARRFLPRYVTTDFWELGREVPKGEPRDV